MKAYIAARFGALAGVIALFAAGCSTTPEPYYADPWDYDTSYYDYYGAGYDSFYDDDWFYDYYDYDYDTYEPAWDYHYGYDPDRDAFDWEEDGLFE